MMALAVVLAVSVPDSAWPATGSGPRLGLHGEGVTRFVIDLSESVPFSVTTATDPARVLIEIPGIEVVGTVPKPWGAVNGMRMEDGRIVLDLRKPVSVRNSFLIAPRDGLGWRLVVDLGDIAEGKSAEAAPVLHPPRSVKPMPAKALPPVKLVPPPQPPAAQPPAEEARSLQTPLSANRIVVTSPNAPATVASAPPVVAQPEPVAVAPAPVVLAPPPAPQPVTIAPTVEKAVRGPNGLPILSAPMPPPPERPVAPAPAIQPPPQPAVASVQPAPPPPAESVAKARDGVPVIVIDPGHGGVDPGATGVSGVYEKHITLAMARDLKAALEKSGRYRVHLTRDRDVFIRLRDRVAIARQYGADLFISLHADAVQNPQIRGLSVYTLSQNASDSEAQALAEKENKADLIAGIDLSHESADVAGILIDLAQRETMNRSAGFAGEVVDEVGQEMDLLGNTHRFAGFAVLKAPDVPAILVEMGYLSNEYEEKQLRQPAYRGRLAKSIAKAVERFFPPSLKAKRP